MTSECGLLLDDEENKSFKNVKLSLSFYISQLSLVDDFVPDTLSTWLDVKCNA